MPDLVEFKPQEHLNIVCAYPTVNTQHSGLFKKVGDTIVDLDQLNSFKPQALSKIVWAFVAVNVESIIVYSRKLEILLLNETTCDLLTPSLFQTLPGHLQLLMYNTLVCSRKW